jgi:hypothetical protein
MAHPDKKLVRSWLYAKEVRVRTTNQRLSQLRAVAHTGTTQTVALNPRLYRAYQKAMPKVQQFIKKNPQAGSRAIFNTLRREMAKDPHLKLSGKPIHHWRYPIHKHPSRAIDPNNLVVTDKKPLSVGTQKPGHTQIHQAIGGKGLHTRDGMYSKMAWGKQTGIQRDYSFANPGDRVPLEQVKGKIAAFNRQSSMAKTNVANLARPVTRVTKKPVVARTAARMNHYGTGQQFTVKMRSAPGQGPLTLGKLSAARAVGTLSAINKLGPGLARTARMVTGAGRVLGPAARVLGPLLLELL